MLHSVYCWYEVYMYIDFIAIQTANYHIVQYVAGEYIGEFGKLTAILQCFTYQYSSYPNIFNRFLLL